MAESPDAEELLSLLFSTMAALRNRLRVHQGSGLGPSHHMLLMRLHPKALGPWQAMPHGPARVSELARDLQLTPAAITQIVTELERRGLVRREHSTEDRRVVLVYMTAQGEEMFAQQRLRRRAAVQGILDRLEPHDREVLVRILRRLHGEASAAEPNVPAGETVRRERRGSAEP